MKPTYLLLFFLTLTTTIFAQEQMDDLPIKVLLDKIQESAPDSNRVKLQLALGKALLLKPGSGNKEIDSVMNYAAQALALSRKLHFQSGIGNEMLLIALVQNKQNQGTNGLVTAQQALKLFEQIKDYRGIAEDYIIIAQHYDIVGQDLALRLKYYRQAADLFIRGGFRTRAATTLMDIGDLLILQRDFMGALKELYPALYLYETLNYPRLQGVYILIAFCSAELGDYTTATKYDLLALKTAQQVRDTSIQLARIYLYTGETYRHLKEYSQAFNLYQKAQKIAIQYNDQSYIAVTTDAMKLVAMSIGNYSLAEKLANKLSKMQITQSLIPQRNIEASFVTIFIRNGELGKAEYHAKKIEALLKRTRPDDLTAFQCLVALARFRLRNREFVKCIQTINFTDRMLKNKRLATYDLQLELLKFQVDSAQGSYLSAIRHFRVYKIMVDSTVNSSKTNQMASLRIEAETEQKNQNILLLTKQGELKDSQLKQSRNFRNFLLVAAAFFLVVIGLFYNRNRIKQKNNLLLQAHQKEINAQNLSLRTLVSDKNQLLADKDELLSDKDLLLKELNHRVKNNLQMIMSLLESQSAYLDNKDAQIAVTESQNRVQALALIHQKLYQVNNVTEVDMQEYIVELVTYLNSFYGTNEQAILIQYEVDDIHIDVSQAIPVGLILNEAITNSIKHAFKGRSHGEIRVYFRSVSDKVLRLRVSDDGIGLSDKAELKRTGSLGMTLIRGLTKQLKGILQIDQKGGLAMIVEFSTEIMVYKDGAGAGIVRAAPYQDRFYHFPTQE